jgi:ATP-dependent 26S proteasome regulatory subunit
MDQDGMIIIACANNISHLDPALLRDGRFEVVKFEYMGRNEICEMIKKYYDCKLTDEQHLRIRDDKLIQNLRLKNTCVYKLKDDISVDDLIDFINSMKEVKICNNNQKKLDIDETFEL